MRAIAIGGALAMLALLAACGGDDDDTGGITRWASAFCAESQSFSDAMRAIPTTSGMPFEQRKPEALRTTDRAIAAIDDAIARIERVDAPGAAAALQDANVAELRALRKAFADSKPALERAASAADIEAVNAEMSIRITRAQDDYAKATKNVSKDVTAALRGVTRCGEIT